MKNVLNKIYRDKLIERINSLSPEAKGLWGKMNSNQMMCHCYDQIRMSLGQIETQFIGSKMQEAILKHLVLFGMPIPKGKIETVKELKQGKGGTKPNVFEEDKQRLILLIENFGSSINKNPTYKHPAFGKMTKQQWGRLVYQHTDYHLSQFGK